MTTYKVRWTHAAKADRLGAIGCPNERRAFYAHVKGEWIGSIYNSSASVLNSDGKGEWYVSFFGSPKNITLSHRFAFDQIDEAKAFFVGVLNAIMNATPDNTKYTEFKTRMLARGHFKEVPRV